jgi:hypothetical protein
MNSRSKITAPASAAPSNKPSRAERYVQWLKMVDEMSPGLKGVEPPIDSFADVDPADEKPDTSTNGK